MTGPERPIVQERVYAAPRERVFAAWADARALGRILCPAPDMGPADVELDFRVGGRFRVTMHGAEHDYVQTGEYLVIDPPKALVFTWVSDFLPAASAHTRVSVTLEAQADATTRLVLVHDHLPVDEIYDGHVSGWARILACLDDEIRERSPAT